MGDGNAHSHNLESAAAVMVRVSVELQSIAATLDDISIPVENALENTENAGRRQFIHSMQQLDHMRQAVESIAYFLESLSRVIPDGWRVNSEACIESLPLAKLADRLCARETPGGAQHKEGDWELF